MQFKSLLFLLFFCTTSYIFYGQESDDIKSLKFKHLSTEDGLSQSSVLSILQDKNGYLWFGTRDGLNRYDGHSFKTFRHISNDSTSLSNSYIKVLFEDQNGNLWIGTNNGLNLYVEGRDIFKRVIHAEENENNVIWSIIEDDNEHLWIATNNTINNFNVVTGKIRAERSIELKSPIRALLKDSKDRIWIKTTNTIGSYDPMNGEFKDYKLRDNDFDDLNLNIISVLFEDSNHNIWLGYKNGLATLNQDKDTFEVFNNQFVDPIKDNVRTLHEDPSGNLWVGTYNGIYIINADKNAINHFKNEENNSHSLSQNSIYKIFEDKKGDIWIGTYAGGINYYDRSYDSFKLFSSGSNNTLNYKVVSAIVEDDTGNLWIGTEGGGLNFYNKSTEAFDYFVHKENNQNSISTNNVKAIIKDRENNLWIGTHEGGLNFLNQKNDFFHFKYDQNDSLSISNDRVIALCEGIDNVWLGTSGGGVNIIDKTTKQISRLQNISECSGPFVYTITKSSISEVLFIGGSEGLCKVNLATKEVEPIEFKLKDGDIFSQNATLCIFEDQAQNLWIGTEGDGLYYYEIASGKSSKIGIEDGLLSEIIYGILPDNNGNLWLSTNQGLSRLHISTKQIKNFDVSDGIQGNEFNYGSYLKSKNGDLMFGGANGLTIFNPNEILENSFIPPVLITDILVNNEPYLPEKGQQITLNHKQNVFSFNFLALSYSKPNKNQYAYQLVGFDDDWIDIGNRKSTTYTNIDPGTYTFKVKAANSDGLWNENGDQIQVVIRPAPWYSWWAYLIYGLLLILIGLLIWKNYMIRRYEKLELQKEREEKERIKEVNDLKLQLFTNISHDFRTPLTLIVGPLEKMIADNLSPPFVVKQHKIMHKNAMILLQLVNQFLDFRKNESGQFKLEATQNNIVPFVEEIKKSFDELAAEKRIDFNLKYANRKIDVWFDKVKLRKIIYNLLSNAFKNTKVEGQVGIHISTEEKLNANNQMGQFVKLEVRDTGKGIAKENIKFIFERFYQLGQKHGGSLGTGIGLSLTKSLVNLHKGFIDIKSTEGKGSSFTVLLPLGNSHLSEQEIIEEQTDETEDSLAYNTPFHLLGKTNPSQDEVDNERDASLSTILIVEDNNDVRSFLKTIFSPGFNILEAEDGKKGLEIAKTESLDLIISDIMMPIVDGVELCKAIKTDIKTSHIPVVLLTAKTSAESQRSGYESGADIYIPKPFNPELLVTRVNNLIQSRQNLIEKFRKDAIVEPKAIAATSTDELFLEKAFKIVMDNVSNPEFAINNLAKDLHMSRSILYKKIKALTGQTIHQFVKTIKLKHAGQLLIARKDLNISEVAYEIGFSDVKHFRKLFKELFKELPSDYRNNPVHHKDKEVLDS